MTKSSAKNNRQRKNAPRTDVAKSDPGASSASRERENGAGAGQRAACDKCGQEHRRCAGHTRNGPNTGKPCGANPRAGQNLCIKHGGNHPAHKKVAKERLLELVDPALATLASILADPNTSDRVKVSASLGILDRAGFRPGLVVAIETGDAWSKVLDAGQMVDNRELGGGDYEGARIAAAQQIGLDMRSENWREYDAEDDQAFEDAFIERDEHTVTGVVVGRYEVPKDLDPNDPPRYEPDQ